MHKALSPFERKERRAAPQGHAAAPQAPEAQPRNSAEDVPAEAGTKHQDANPERPDTATRLDIAACALIVIFAYAIAGHGIWDHAGRPFP